MFSGAASSDVSCNKDELGDILQWPVQDPNSHERKWLQLSQCFLLNQLCWICKCGPKQRLSGQGLCYGTLRGYLCSAAFFKCNFANFLLHLFLTERDREGAQFGMGQGRYYYIIILQPIIVIILVTTGSHCCCCMNLNVTHVSPINQERVGLDVKQRVAHCYPKFPTRTGLIKIAWS